MRAKGIHHLGVAVEDLDDAVETYRKLFGAELERRDMVESQGDLRREIADLTEQGVHVIDEEPHRGLFGLEVAFVHPESLHGVLAELVASG